MALLYRKETMTVTSKDIIIRPIEDDDYQVAITFPGEEAEGDVTEILLTAEEVKECYDVLFNR